MYELAVSIWVFALKWAVIAGAGWLVILAVLGVWVFLSHLTD